MVSLHQPDFPKSRKFRSIYKSIKKINKIFINRYANISEYFFGVTRKTSHLSQKYNIVPSKIVRVGVYYMIFLLVLTGIVQPNVLDFRSDIDAPVIASIVFAQQIAQEQQDGSLKFESLLTDSVDDQRLVYTVKSGESLGMIAKQFGTSTKELLSANKLANADLVRPGQKVIISYSKNQLIYEVEDNQSVRDFSLKYELDIDEFMSLNFIQNQNKLLTVGDQMLLDLSVPEAQRKGLYQKPEYETPEELLALDENENSDDLTLGNGEGYVDDAFVSDVELLSEGLEVGQRIISAEETTNNFDENELRQLQEIKNQEMEAAKVEEIKRQAALDAQTPSVVSKPSPSTPEAPAPVQQRVIEATASSSQCSSNKCSYKGKCRDLPGNASCSGESSGEAWTCRAGYVEYGSACIPKAEYDKKKKAQQARAVTKPAKHGVVSQRYFNPYNDGYGNGWAGGHCTHGAGRRRWKNYGIMTNWRGNGGKRYYNASAAGRQVGQTPEVGAIFSTKGAAQNGRYGHVGVITQIDRSSGSMMVVDMNYVGQYTFSQRRVPIKMPGLIGFIYPRKK